MLQGADSGAEQLIRRSAPIPPAPGHGQEQEVAPRSPSGSDARSSSISAGGSPGTMRRTGGSANATSMPWPVTDIRQRPALFRSQRSSALATRTRIRDSDSATTAALDLMLREELLMEVEPADAAGFHLGHDTGERGPAVLLDVVSLGWAEANHDFAHTQPVSSLPPDELFYSKAQIDTEDTLQPEELGAAENALFVGIIPNGNSRSRVDGDIGYMNQVDGADRGSGLSAGPRHEAYALQWTDGQAQGRADRVLALRDDGIHPANESIANHASPLSEHEARDQAILALADAASLPITSAVDLIDMQALQQMAATSPVATPQFSDEEAASEDRKSVV